MFFLMTPLDLLNLLPSLLDLLPTHHSQILHQNPFKILKVIEYLDTPSPIESSRLQKPHIAVLGIVSIAVQRFAEGIDLLLDIRVLPSHVILHLVDQSKGPVLLAALPRVVLLEEVQELLEIVLAVLIIEVKDEGDGRDAEDLDLLGLAVDLQVLDQLIFGADLLTELEMVDDTFLGVGPHLLIVMLLLAKDPLKVGNPFPGFHLTPDLTLEQDLSNKLLVIVASDDHESRLVTGFDQPDLLMLAGLRVYLSAVGEVGSTGQARGVEAARGDFLALVSDLLG